MPKIFILVLMEFQWPSLQIYWKFSHIKWKKLNDVNHILMWLSLTGSLFLLIIQFKELKQKFITDNVFNCVLAVLENLRLRKNAKHFINTQQPQLTPMEKKVRPSCTNASKPPIQSDIFVHSENAHNPRFKFTY